MTVLRNSLLVPERYSNRFSSNPYPLNGLVFYADLWNVEQQGFLLSYDGNDYLSNATADFRSADSSGAVEVWFRSSSTANNQTLVCSSDTGTTTSFLRILVASTTGFITVSGQNAGGNTFGAVGSTNICDGKWHLLIISSSGSSFSIIVDGVAETVSPSGTDGNNGKWYDQVTLRDNLTIGAMTHTSTIGFVIGEIGFTRIYSRTMATTEAQLNYQRGRKATASDTTGLVFNLPTTEGTGNPVDTVGSLTMTVTGATWVEGLMDRSVNAFPMTSFGSPVWSNQGRTFDNTNDTILVPHNAVFNFATGDFTWMMWFNRTVNTDTDRMIYKDAAWAVNGNPGADTLFYRVRQDASNFASMNTVLTFPSGTWYLITAMKSGSIIQLYRNTTLDTATPTYTGLGALSNIDTATNLYIGSEGGTANWTNGKIGEFWVYNRALTAQEIQQIYNGTRWRYT